MRVMLQVLTNWPRNPKRPPSATAIAYLPGMTFRSVPRIEVELVPRDGFDAADVVVSVSVLAGVEFELEVIDTFFTEDAKSSAHVRMVSEIRRQVLAYHSPEARRERALAR